MHLALSLIVSAAMCAPWPGFRSLRVALVLFGGGALVYSALVLRRARQQRSYRPVLEDWIWHFLLPAVAYAAVMVAALFLHRGAEGPLFAVGTATLLLLCVAIHNAWDTITYFTINAVRGVPPQGDAAPAPENVASMSGPGDEP